MCRQFQQGEHTFIMCIYRNIVLVVNAIELRLPQSAVQAPGGDGQAWSLCRSRIGVRHEESLSSKLVQTDRVNVFSAMVSHINLISVGFRRTQLYSAFSTKARGIRNI